MTRLRSALLIVALAVIGCGDSKSQLPKEISAQPTGNPGNLKGGPGEQGRGKLALTK